MASSTKEMGEYDGPRKGEEMGEGSGVWENILSVRDEDGEKWALLKEETDEEV